MFDPYAIRDYGNMKIGVLGLVAMPTIPLTPLAEPQAHEYALRPTSSSTN
ncbi:MAG: hypothetical protein IPK53_20535 [bacterium]|nr:hypothetical protein [bacterium]